MVVAAVLCAGVYAYYSIATRLFRDMCCIWGHG